MVLCGSFRRTKIDPAFFHFQYTLYQILQCPATALRLPSDCPPTALRVSFRYPRRALFIFVSVIIPHFPVDIRGHSATTFRFFIRFSAFVIVVRIKSELPLFFRSGSLFCACLALAKAVAIPYNKLLLMHKQQGKKSHDR